MHVCVYVGTLLYMHASFSCTCSSEHVDLTVWILEITIWYLINHSWPQPWAWTVFTEYACMRMWILQIISAGNRCLCVRTCMCRYVQLDCVHIVLNYSEGSAHIPRCMYWNIAHIQSLTDMYEHCLRCVMYIKCETCICIYVCHHRLREWEECVCASTKTRTFNMYTLIHSACLVTTRIGVNTKISQSVYHTSIIHVLREWNSLHAAAHTHMCK